jgi:hypothetical protein
MNKRIHGLAYSGSTKAFVLECVPHFVFVHRLTSILSRLVLETLEPLSEDRKCFRLVNGVLIERTVKDVVPALRTNQEGLKKVLEDLVKQYKSKQDELDKWKVRSRRSQPDV